MVAVVDKVKALIGAARLATATAELSIAENDILDAAKLLERVAYHVQAISQDLSVAGYESEASQLRQSASELHDEAGRLAAISGSVAAEINRIDDIRARVMPEPPAPPKLPKL